MLRHVAYFRSKFRTLPVAYDSFIRTCLEPGGTVVVSECTLDWPTTRIGDRHVYQFGALGGASQQDYFAGGARVKAYLAREGVRRDRWDPPKPDGRSPEAEWGFEPSLLHDVERLARENGYRVLRLVFADPEHLSPLVADLHADWYERRGLDAKRLIVESFVLIDPYRVLRTGAVPFWMTFNMQPSFDFLQNYVSRAGPFEDIHLGLFAHGVESVGLPPIDAWRGILTQARQEGSFLGVSPSAYPAHFSTFARYHIDLRKIAIRSEIGAPMPLAWFERFVHDSADPDLVRLEKAF